MGRFIPMIAVVALAVAACTSAASPSPSTAPAASSAPAASPSAEAVPTAPSAAPTAAERAAASPRPSPRPSPVTISASVTFSDGTCTYTGPAVVPRASMLSVTLANDPALTDNDRAELMVVAVDGGVTWETVLADSAQPGSLDDPPSWIEAEDLHILTANIAATGRPTVAPMTADRYLVQCVVEPQGATGTIEPHPAVLLTVLDG